MTDSGEQERVLKTSRATGQERDDTGTGRLVKVAVMLLLPLLVAAVAACDSNPAPATSTSIPTVPVPLITATSVVTATGTAVNSRAPYDGVPEGKPKYATNNLPDLPEVSEEKPAGQLPSFAVQLQSSSRDKVVALYQGAVDHYNDYSHMPCYCGCAMYQHPHTSLARCFIQEEPSGGDIVFTDHSTTCEICQGVAAMTVNGLANNTALDLVRVDVFQKYKYTGTWTDTPAP